MCKPTLYFTTIKRARMVVIGYLSRALDLIDLLSIEYSLPRFGRNRKSIFFGFISFFFDES